MQPNSAGEQTTRITIREALPGDAERIIAFVQRVSAEPGVDVLTGPGEFTITVEEEEKILGNALVSDNSVFVVAEAGGEIVGLANCSGGRRRATRHNVVLGISVAREWRDKGVGTRIMRWLIDWARSTGVVTRVELEVFARNSRAIHLYEKCGFVLEGRRKAAFYRDGEYHDGLIMALLLF